MDAQISVWMFEHVLWALSRRGMDSHPNFGFDVRADDIPWKRDTRKSGRYKQVWTGLGNAEEVRWASTVAEGETGEKSPYWWVICNI